VRKFFVDLLIGFDLNRKASPGMPLMLVAQSNESLIDEMGMTLVHLAESRLKLLMLDPMVVRRFTPQQLVEMYFVDAVRTFVKQEPHSNEKILQRRMRLISSRGLVDQMVERFLFQRYQNWCISKWDKIPQKPGMGHTDEMMSKVWCTVQAECRRMGSVDNSDVSGWDFSCLLDDMLCANEVRMEIMDPPPCIRNAMINITYCMANALWCTSDGALFVQRLMGVMKSGSYCTADLNSIMRVLRSYEVTFDLGGQEDDCFAIAMGDDCVESAFGGIEQRKDAYLGYGQRLTDQIEVRAGDSFEFTSHLYREPGVASLSAWPKSLYRLLMKEFNATDFGQFAFECRHNPELPEIVRFLYRVGWFPSEYEVLIEVKHCAIGLACGSVWEPQNLFRETSVRNCFEFMSTKNQKEKVKKEAEKEVRKEIHRLLPASASSTGKQKMKVVSKPKYAAGGSVKEFATPYNALNSQILKFQPSQVQAALMAWGHTVANPRTLNPHPVPIAAAPGASASVPQMFKCTLYGKASANAAGKLFIGANADAWFPKTPGGGAIEVPTPSNTYLTLPGVRPDDQGLPVHFTTGVYAASTYPASVDNGDTVGVGMVGLPFDFVPNMLVDTRYNCVSVELRARPVQAALYASGELVAFNYRRCPVQETLPNGKTLGEMLGIEQTYLSRNRVACPNWPSDKWLTTVAVPNTSTCFGQWFPKGLSGPTDANAVVGQPQVYIFGDGLPANAPVEFEATYNYALYGTRTYTTSGSGNSDSIQVDGSRAMPVVANGFPNTLKPLLMNTSKVHPGGAAAVVKAEQQDGRMPSVKDVVSGIKTGASVFEAVTGTDIGEEIASIIGEIGMFLL
jgi:hypothetical protein